MMKVREKAEYWYRARKLDQPGNAWVKWQRCTVQSYRHIQNEGPTFDGYFFETFKTDKGENPNDHE